MHGGGRAWETVLRRIEADLVSGALAPGDHLPAERTLAVELGVGRSSVREALRVLEVMGLIRTGTGSGPQSGAVIVARPSGGMAVFLRLQVAAQGFSVPDVVAARVALESEIVAALAVRVADADAESDSLLAPVRELLAAMEAVGAVGTDDGAGAREGELRDEFLSLDQGFHAALADASGNAVIAAMMTGLRDSIESYVRAGADSLPSWPVTRARLQAEHRAVVDAVAAGDPALASALVRAHILEYHAETLVASPPHTPTTD
ncbi:FCD domain-containing protein [Herbiconiux moechotypicola]|nr:FCD domain-containing protein [Herbiconiux moechotypicola]